MERDGRGAGSLNDGSWSLECPTAGQSPAQPPPRADWAAGPHRHVHTNARECLRSLSARHTRVIGYFSLCPHEVRRDELRVTVRDIRRHGAPRG